MKIGIYDPYLDDLGGGEKYMMTIAECLTRENDVSVFWDDERVKKALMQRFSINLSGVQFVPNIFQSNTSQVRRLKETQKYDLIIFLSDGSIPFLLSKKTILHIQQPLSFRKVSLLNSLKLKRIDTVFCNSEFTKKYTDKRFGIQSKILYPPIVLKPKKIKKENFILHVGRFRVQDSAVGIKDFKKQKEMIQAFCKMIEEKKLKGWKLVMCVSVKDEDKKSFAELQKIAKEFPVEFELNKSNDELWEFYSRAKIYWHASGLGENLDEFPDRAEHFGISTVEAMGAGAVPVVINSGGQKEIVKNSVSGYLWNTVEELIGMTMQLIEDEKRLAVMSMEARVRAEYFAKIDFCQALNKLITVHEK